jgi:ribosomal protein S18 acetylase RimI-like enzyme
MSPIAVARLAPDAITDHDVAAVNRLLQEFRPGVRTLDAAELRAVAEDVFLFVARQQDGRAVGMATLVVFRKPIGFCGRVEDVIVTAECRGLGAGRLLMRELIKAARALKLDYLDLTSNPRRTAARSLYQSLGFVIRDTNAFRLAL